MKNSTYGFIPGMLGRTSLKRYIVELVCSDFNVNPNLLKVKSRQKDIVECRRYIAKLLRKNCYSIKKGFYEITLREVSHLIGIDHSSIIYHVNKLTDEMRFYKPTRERYERFQALIDKNKSCVSPKTSTGLKRKGGGINGVSTVYSFSQLDSWQQEIILKRL